VPILSTQTLFENILKHNIVSKEEPIYIVLFQNDDGTLSIKNNIQTKSLSNVNSSGTGLANLNERFALLGGQEIIVSKTATDFIVTLKPFVNEHSDH
jgi:glucose-6-phosphate-specific signal transduction histidine kinase